MTNGLNTPRRKSKPDINERSNLVDDYINTIRSSPYIKGITFTPHNHNMNNIKIFSNKQYLLELTVYNTTLHLAERLPIAATSSDEYKNLLEQLTATTVNAKCLINDIQTSLRDTPDITRADTNPLPESVTERLEDLESCLNKLNNLSEMHLSNKN